MDGIFILGNYNKKKFIISFLLREIFTFFYLTTINTHIYCKCHDIKSLQFLLPIFLSFSDFNSNQLLVLVKTCINLSTKRRRSLLIIVDPTLQKTSLPLFSKSIESLSQLTYCKNRC